MTLEYSHRNRGIIPGSTSPLAGLTPRMVQQISQQAGAIADQAAANALSEADDRLLTEIGRLPNTAVQHVREMVPDSDLLVQLANETTTAAAQVDADAQAVATARAEVQLISGLTGEDDAVAALVQSPTSDVGSSLRTLFTSETMRRAGFITPRDFGATPDDSDSTQAMQDFFDYLGQHGGNGLIDGVYRTTATIDVIDPPRGFSVAGYGENTSAIEGDFATPVNVLNLRNATGVTLERFGIRGRDETSLASHGVSVINGTGVELRQIIVRHYLNTGIIVFRHNAWWAEGMNVRNRVISCAVFGGGLANNGIALESATASKIIDSDVFDLNRAGNPSYGLQLKNACEGCEISGGSVDGAIAGIAFGNDDPALIGARNIVSGVIVRNAIWGAAVGRAHSNYLSYTVDMANGCSYGLRLTGHAECNIVRLRATSPEPGSVIAYIQESFNEVTVESVDRLGSATLAEFPSTSHDNALVVGRIADRTVTGHLSAPIVDQSAGANRVSYLPHLQELFSLNGQNSLMRMYGASGNAFIQLSHSLSEMMFRVADTDVLRLSPGAVLPGQHNAFSLGNSDRMWRNVFAQRGVITRSNNGTLWRIFVDDSGNIGATQNLT